MTLVVKVINSIRAKALQHRLFKALLLDELDSAACGDLLLRADVRWSSRGKVLQRFVDLPPEIKTLLSEKERGARGTVNGRVDYWTWGFLTDRTGRTELTEQQRAPGKRPAPAPHDKRSKCAQGQTLCLDHTA